MDNETTFKILELITTVSIPVVIIILGFLLTRKIEDSKNESLKKYYWHNKWTESFFEKYKEYINAFSILLANLELLGLHVQKGTQNEPIGAKLQSEINELTTKVFQLGIELKIQASSLYGGTSEITNTIEKVYTLLANTINKKEGDLLQIFSELKILNNITGKIFDKTVIQ